MADLNLIGHTFGRLKVVEYVGMGTRGREWRCICDCGSELVASTSRLRSGSNRSCGCARREFLATRRTHGQSDSALYKVWRGMRERCGNSNHTSFHNYGGRGIAVCAEWKESFEAFARDMASTYDSGLTLERKDVNGGYGPGNCVWASPKEQSENTRRNVYFDTPAGRVIRREAVKLLGVRSSTFQMLEARGELPWARVEAM